MCTSGIRINGDRTSGAPPVLLYDIMLSDCLGKTEQIHKMIKNHGCCHR
jgi:hypothetical protein